MTRKRKQTPAEEWLGLIILGDWKASAVACMLILLLGYVLIPALFSSSPITQAFIPATQKFANYGAGFSALVSTFKLAVAWVNQPLDEDEPTLFDEKLPGTSHPTREIDIPPKPAKQSSSVPNGFEHRQSRAQSTHTPTEAQWSITFLQSLDWKVFETLCTEYFKAKGIPSKETSIGTDGGVDIMLFGNNANKPYAVVQCKQWSKPVGVNLLRELLGVMTHQQVSKGFFITSRTFTEPAETFGKSSRLALIDGNKLIKRLKTLDFQQQQTIYKKITLGDFTTPTCAKCGIKMVKRIGNGKPFWGCQNFPRCRQTLRFKNS